MKDVSAGSSSELNRWALDAESKIRDKEMKSKAEAEYGTQHTHAHNDQRGSESRKRCV
jgi:hypothetical protein